MTYPGKILPAGADRGGAGLSHPARALRRSLPEEWGPHHDNRLRDAGGRYREIAKLSDEWGVETRVLIGRYHRLRATGDAPAAPQKPERVPGPAERAAKDCVKPTMLLIIRSIEGRGVAGYDEVSRDTGISRSYIATVLSRNESGLTKAGWRIVRSQPGGRPAPMKLSLERLS